MSIVTICDKQFKHYISRTEIGTRVAAVAAQLQADVEDKNPLFVCVLNGSFVFAADILRCFTFPCEISFVKVSSYHGTASTGELKQLIGLNEQLAGRTVVVLEDIIDTGITMSHIIKQLYDLGALDVKIACCFFKPLAFKGNYHIDYKVLEIDDLFVVGYGMDYNGFGRNLPDLYQLCI